MASDRSMLERQMERVELRPFTLDGFHHRRQRKDRNRRIGNALVALLVAGAAIGGLLRVFSSSTIPASDPRTPFLGEWISTDLDGSTQTMTIRASREGAVEFVLHDDAASVCSGAPATMTGTGRLEGARELVIPSPVLTCDDGSGPDALGGPPLEERLRNLTFVHDPETDALTDSQVVWNRVGGEDSSSKPRTSGGMWPQSSLEEVRLAQELADAGDPRYTWQVEPQIEEYGGPSWRVGESWENAEIVERFLREELGWEDFLFNQYVGWEGYLSNMTYVRCAPGGTNALYPDDPFAGGCAPTIDELRYEAVQFDLVQPGRRGPTGIWVVSSWEMISPVAQVVPPTDAEAAAVLQPFLQARIEGEGAERFLLGEEVPPLLYATTAGAPYERFEFERVGGPQWPFGDMGEFRVRLFAEGGATVVEQLFFLNHEAFLSPLGGPLGLDYRPSSASDTPTTENGKPLAVPYGFLDGEVTYAAAWPWGVPWTNIEGLLLDGDHHERLELVADPLPVGTGCEQGAVPADTEALARSIRSDPDLEATRPVAVSVGGIPALWMDVVLAPGASVCETWGAPQVLTPDDDDWPGVGLEHGHRMRLYLLDLPEELSARILAIAIAAPEARFEVVMEAAAQVVDSFEFHTR